MDHPPPLPPIRLPAETMAEIHSFLPFDDAHRLQRLDTAFHREFARRCDKIAKGLWEEVAFSRMEEPGASARYAAIYLEAARFAREELQSSGRARGLRFDINYYKAYHWFVELDKHEQEQRMEQVLEAYRRMKVSSNKR